VLYLNETATGIERLLAPRIALAEAEHLAFPGGLHVWFVMADLESYCEGRCGTRHGARRSSRTPGLSGLHV
jgi:vacuolar-type H+-ATPase subunit B/Vma2